MKTGDKLLVGGGLSAVLLAAARVFGQTNAPAAPMPSDLTDNMVVAAWHQIANNPASLMVIAVLCVIAWLADDTPFINSRYVAHLTVTIGASSYWVFAGPSSVPKNYPYPAAVLVVNGIICGFVAFLIHRQAVARVISFIRVRAGSDPTDTGILRKPNQP